jgi:hypothetical protein
LASSAATVLVGALKGETVEADAAVETDQHLRGDRIGTPINLTCYHPT